MSKLKFHEYAQKIRPKRSRKMNQETFLARLFYFAGMQGQDTKRGVILEDYDIEYLRKLYSGYRPFNQKIKGSFSKPITRESLIAFFDEYIGSANLSDVMQRFDVPDVTPQHKVIFFESLCTQLEYLIDVDGEEAEDIVALEYVRILQRFDACGLQNAVGHLTWDMDKLRQIISKLHELASLLKDFEFNFDDSSILNFLISLKDISEDMQVTEFVHSKTLHTVNEFVYQRDSLEQYLSDIISSQNYKIAQLTRKDAVYVVNAVQSMRKSLYASINKVFHAENMIKEEIMLLEAHTHLRHNNMYLYNETLHFLE